MAESEIQQCGLDFTNAELDIHDSKNFSPEKFHVNTAKIFCEQEGCPLSQGVEFRFPAIAASTRGEIAHVFEREARIQDSQLSEGLMREKMEHCPYYQQKFNK